MDHILFRSLGGNSVNFGLHEKISRHTTRDCKATRSPMKVP